MRHTLSVLLLVAAAGALVVAGCTLPRPDSTPVVGPSATVAPPITTPPSPLPEQRTAAVTPATTPSSTGAPATTPAQAATSAVTPPAPAAATIPPPAAAASRPPDGLPPANWDAWDIYEVALRPAQRQGLRLAGLTQYHLAVTLAADFKTLTGAARIRYVNRSTDTLDAVYLHLFPNLWDDGMRVSGVQVDGRAEVYYLQDNDALLKVTLAVPLAPDGAVEIALNFSDPIPQNGEVGNYGEFAYQDQVLALAHFYPTVVVYDGSGWRLETPAAEGDVIFHQASLYDVTLTAPANLIVVATGQTLSRRENDDGTATWRLVGGPMRDFNIVASPRYEKTTQAVGDVTINSYYLPEDSQSGQDALAWAAQALNAYQSDFGPYPYSELDMAETATSAGGIEYPGLVVIARDLYRDPGAQRHDLFEGATTHEVAHQWWYNVVGNDQLNNPWLDESLAQYTTYLYYQAAHGQAGAQGFVESLRGRWQRVNDEPIPVGLPVAAYHGNEYSAIVYGRGPLFLLALADKLGQDTMLSFLRQYYQKYAWQVATPADFQGLLEEVAGQDLSALFKDWVYASK